MICLDTTFLVDLWRAAQRTEHPTVRLLRRHGGETAVVPAHAAGEFLEGGAAVSPERLRESLQFLRLFEIGGVDLETAVHYARIVTDLRSRSLLAGLSKPDAWIAAWAVQHGALLVTRNVRHFAPVSNLHVEPYEQA